MTSLGSRLTIWYVLMITGTVAIVLVTGRALLGIELVRSIDQLNISQFQEIESRVEDDHLINPEADFLQHISSHSKFDAPLYFFQVRDSHGTILFRSANMGREIFPANPPGKLQWTYSLNNLDDVRISTFAAGSYQLQIARSLGTSRQLLYYYYQVSALVLGIVAALSFFVGHRMSRLALDPIRGIQQAASRISAENLKERIPVSRVKDEVSDLTILLNEMFDRLEKAFARLSRFAGEASHELKTPLSIIKLQSEKLLIQGDLSEPQQEAMQQLLKSINGLNLVIEKLLFIARAEAGAIQAQQKQQSTRNFIEAFVANAQVLCEDREVELAIIQNDDIQVSFDEALMRQVLLNLLSNALKVTLAGGRITITSIASEFLWRVTVEDTGPGLADHVSEEEMFKPFVRLNPELNWSISTGTGLGLAICRSILDLHRGHIHVENRQTERGLRVIFEMPGVSTVRVD